MSYKEIVSREPITKGWSEDQKFRVLTQDGTSYLLRISPFERKAHRLALFDRLKEVSRLGVPICEPVEIGECEEGVYTLYTWVDGKDAEEMIPELTAGEQYQMGAKAGKVLVFIYDDMADFEITFLTHLLGTDGGKEILPVAFDNKAIRSKCGLVYQPVKMINEVVIDDSIEGLIIPGGWNGEMRDELTHMIQVLHEKGKLLAAICAGPRFLAKAGVLAHQKYTTSIVEWTEMHRNRFGEEDPFPRQHFQNERVIRDQNIVTAKGNAFVDFAVAVCDWFSLFDDEEDRLEFEAMIKGNS